MDKLILIAVDEPKTLKMIQNLLLYNGYPLLIAQTGEVALRAALECKPDLILVDLHEPGLEVVRILKKHVATRKIPLLELGMSLPKWDGRRTQRSLCSEFVANPLHLPSLLETIRRFLTPKPAQSGAPRILCAGKRPFSHMPIPPA